MTGFASLTREDERATIGITIRAVNHRFLDLQLRIPGSLADLEPRVRGLLQKRLARGRVELAISIQLRQASMPTVELNADFANALAAAIDQARERGLVAGTLTPGDLLRLPQAVTIRERPVEADPALEAQLAASVEAAVEQALLDLDAMRTREGGHLRSDLDARKALLADLIERLRQSRGICHLMGLISTGGVHSMQEHVVALARAVEAAGVPVAIHAFLDGRDTPPKSGHGFMRRLMADIQGLR